jgi:hypothetical protein
VNIISYILAPDGCYGWMDAFIHSIIAGAKENKTKNVSAVKFLSVAFIYSIFFSLLWCFPILTRFHHHLHRWFTPFLCFVFLGQFIAV